MTHSIIEFLDMASAALWPDRKSPSIKVTAFVLVLLAGILLITAAN